MKDIGKREISSCVNYNSDNVLKLNYTSGYYNVSIPPLSAARLAKDTNPWLLYDVLPNIKATVIFVSDFITEDLASTIIGENE